MKSVHIKQCYNCVWQFGSTWIWIQTWRLCIKFESSELGL